MTTAYFARPDRGTPIATNEAAMSQHCLTLIDLAASWETHRQPAAETARQMRVIAHDLGALSHVGDPSALTRGHLRAFHDDLLAHHSRPTARKMFGLAHALLQFGFRVGLLDSNPAQGMTVSASTVAAQPHVPFTPSELTRIFSHPVFTTQRPPSQRNGAGSAAYWLPLILLCSGARLRTAASLRTDHLLVSADASAIPYWQFAPPPGSVKKSEGYRQPVHPILCRLGLLDYAATLPSGSDLFPLLLPDRAGRRTAGFSTYFSRFLRREVSIVEPGKGTDSFRYTFALACRRAEVPFAHECALRGSALPDRWNGDLEWEIPLAVLRKQMARLTFPGFPL
ncbi:hypothetical protein ACUXAV_003778 [Cupriavidus metallidurans]|jgi:hypothetical protein|uniref:hypothetical protein n=1 Tax=Cupriavidus TaxID=106589 RepID=UPI00049301C6|nr:hypothetical protein [Cupriavidus metallidurans]MDE4917480.1 hypothetical protein [Cupriavidus metallidurans]